MYMTTGVLLQLLTHQLADLTREFSHIIVDEAHERDVDMDLVLVMLRRMLVATERLAPNDEVDGSGPRVIIMSATVDASRYCAYFLDAPHVHVGTRPHKVHVLHIEEARAQDNDFDAELAMPIWAETSVKRDFQNARFEPGAIKAAVCFVCRIDASPTYIFSALLIYNHV